MKDKNSNSNGYYLLNHFASEILKDFDYTFSSCIYLDYYPLILNLLSYIVYTIMLQSNKIYNTVLF